MKDRSLKPLTRFKVGQLKKQLDPPSLNSTLPCSEHWCSILNCQKKVIYFNTPENLLEKTAIHPTHVL
jgi:hypothetical protein